MIRLPHMTRLSMPSLIDAMHITRGVEIGTSQGWFSMWLLQYSKLETLWSVDPYAHRSYRLDRQCATIGLKQFKNRSVMIRRRSISAAMMASRHSVKFGFIYIDGDHRASAVREDIDAWLPLLDRPGIFAGHDYVARGSQFQALPIVNELRTRLDEPLYITGEGNPTWFFILGE